MLREYYVKTEIKKKELDNVGLNKKYSQPPKVIKLPLGHRRYVQAKR